MSALKSLQNFFAFTRNEQKIIIFLSAVFLGGAAVKIYKTYTEENSQKQFDYRESDSIFTARSAGISDTSAVTDSLPVQAVLKININTATKKELITLPGIGEAMAERIILYRTEHGKFTSVNDLKKIKGVGEKKFAKLKPLIEAP